jgi:hypothetical protein
VEAFKISQKGSFFHVFAVCQNSHRQKGERGIIRTLESSKSS